MTNGEVKVGPIGIEYMITQLATASPAQRKVLHTLTDIGREATVVEIADHLGIHKNSVRETLVPLVEQGLVVRRTHNPAGRGRPAMYNVSLRNFFLPRPRQWLKLRTVAKNLLTSWGGIGGSSTLISSVLPVRLMLLVMMRKPYFRFFEFSFQHVVSVR